MNPKHRRSLLWQSACILLPLVLLAGLAVWHLFDARKVALGEARATASDLAFRLSSGLHEGFEDLRAKSYLQIEISSLDKFLYPLTPTPVGETAPHRQYLEVVDDPDALAKLLPTLSDASTPAGLPLEPIAAWRLVELNNYRDADLRTLIESALNQHPSIISESLLKRASFTPLNPEGTLIRQNMAITSALQHWNLREEIRSALRPAHKVSPLTESRWLETVGDPAWISVEEGTLSVIHQQSLEQLAVEALAEEAKRHPPYISADISIAEKELVKTDTDGNARVEWDIGDTPEGFIDGENVIGGPFRVSSHISSTTALYAKVRTQTYWYAAVIAISTLAAILGLLALRRSYARQLELGEMKSNFVASVSHELRAPVASVRLLAERLRSGAVTDDAKRDEYYGFIEGESRRLGTLVENVLDFSRIERGLKEYRFAETDLAALVTDTVATMKHFAAERGVHIDVSTDDVLAETDADELRSALVNLIDNAIKFSPKATTVTVSLVSNETHAELSVTDHGPGVPAAEREKVFERFYRSGSELTRETQGTGIGLSIVKHIAEGHRGRVAVDCPPAGGSVLTITIPIQQPAHA